MYPIIIEAMSVSSDVTCLVKAPPDLRRIVQSTVKPEWPYLPDLSVFTNSFARLRSRHPSR